MERDRTRLVLIGASNLWLALPRLLRELEPLDRPRDVLVAAGHGRSLGTDSRYFARELGSILDCGLWDELGRAEGPCTALVTDVGNDLAYGAEAARIAGWLDELLRRLAAHGARTLTTALPLASLERISPLAFEAVRVLVYRGRALERARVLASARELEARFEAAARAHGARHVHIPRECFGWDGIHLRAMARAELLREWLGALDVRLDPRGPQRFAGRLQPARRRLFGREFGCRQPCAESGRGDRVWAY